MMAPLMMAMDEAASLFSDLCHDLSLQAHFNNKINLVPKICLFQHFASMLSMQLKPRECSFPDKTI